MLKKSLKNKRILITGITGFVGQNLVSSFLKKGAVVFGISHKTESPIIAKIDIANFKKLSEIITSQKINQIYHLAGESLVEKGQDSPYSTYRSNILGTVNILELSRIHNLERVVVASTSHVYGKNRLPYYEGYFPRPTRPYETSKACVDLIASSYATSYNLPVLITRFVNLYGPGDMNFTRVIPKTIRSIIKENKITLWSGKAMRDYLFIDDAIDAYLKLGEFDLKKIKENRIFNFGFGNPISVTDLVSQLISISKRTVKIKKVVSPRTLEIQHQFVSSNKAKKLLGWAPQVHLIQGLPRTFDWYEKHFSHQ